MTETSSVLNWIKAGVPRELYDRLEERSRYILANKKQLLKQSFVAHNSADALAVCLCPSCDELYERPMQSPVCSHMLCDDCLVARRGQCAKCSQQAPASKWKFDARTRNAVYKLVLHCPLGDCEWTGRLSALVTHVEEDCDFSPMPCQVCSVFRLFFFALLLSSSVSL